MKINKRPHNPPPPQPLTFRSGGGGGGLGVLPVTVDCEPSPSTILSVSSSYTASSASESRASGSSDIDDTVLDRSHVWSKKSKYLEKLPLTFKDVLCAFSRGIRVLFLPPFPKKRGSQGLRHLLYLEVSNFDLHRHHLIRYTFHGSKAFIVVVVVAVVGPIQHIFSLPQLDKQRFFIVGQ